MPRYFFHLLSPRQCITDLHGEVLSGLKEAAQAGRQTAYELSRNVAPATLVDSSIGVFDENGNIRFEFSLAGASDLGANAIRPVLCPVGKQIH